MTKIKLCGLTRPQDMDVANELHPDYIGFVFAPKSRRYVPPAVAAELRARLDPGIRVVAYLSGKRRRPSPGCCGTG